VAWWMFFMMVLWNFEPGFIIFQFTLRNLHWCSNKDNSSF
jgi:hypothetical protein